MTALYYSVEFSVVVDRPDRRDPSMLKVEAGHRFGTRWDYLERRKALGMFKELVRGDYDSGAEYATNVRVLARDPYGTKGPKYVRRPVERKRKAGAGTCAYDCGHALCLETIERDHAEGLAP